MPRKKKTTDAATAASRTSNRPVDPRLLTYSRAARGFFVLSAAIVFAQTGVIVGFAYLLTRTLVGAIDGEPIGDLVPLLAAALGLVAVRGALIVAAERVSALGAARASLQLRAALVAAVAKLGPGWLAGRSAASLAVTAGHGLESLDAYFGRYLPQLVATAITMPILILAILAADPISGLTVIVTMPLIPIFMILIGLATSAVQNRQYATLHRLATRFADTVGGLGTLKIFGRQHRAADAIETVTRDYKRETMSVLRVSFLSGFALEFLASISVAIIAVTIGLRLLDGQLGLFVGLFVLLLAPEAYLPLRQVGVQFHAAAEGVAATDEIFEVLDAAKKAPAAAAVSGAAVSGAAVSGVAVSGVAVSGVAVSGVAVSGVGVSGVPSPSSAPLLEVRDLRIPRGDRIVGPVDLTVSPGEIVLLEGPSGVGKSSVLAALLGFADFDGDVRVNDHVRVNGQVRTDGALGAEAARGILSWAGQQPGLVSGSVRENVALGAETTDDALVDACLAAAQAADVDAGLVLGAMGSGLSGGQAQRVAVARALYRLRSGRARILALDEPSSALDTATERALWQALRREADGGAGVLLVSHRVSARQIADRVVRVSASAALAPAGGAS